MQPTTHTHKDKAMNILEQFLTQIGMRQIISDQQNQAQWQAFCQQHLDLFVQASSRKPATDIALGLFTKAHIETSSRFEAQSQAAKGVIQAIDHNLKEHQHAFQFDVANELNFITHGWLYLQGYLNMDFSLANDHANNTTRLLSEAMHIHRDEKRCEFMASYYRGKDNRPNKTSHHVLSRLIHWWKSQ